MLMPRGKRPELYVPVAERAAPEKQRLARSPLPPGTARRSARDVIRAVCWDGTPPPRLAPPAPRRRLENATQPAGAVFRLINWTGEEPVEPTPQQNQTSVRAQLDGFQWE